MGTGAQHRLGAAFELAGQRLAKAAGIRKARHDQKGSDAPLQPGDRVCLRNRGLLGRNKIQDRWVAIPYRVEERMSPNSPLYRVHRFDGLGQARVVHRSTILDVKDMRIPNENTAKAPEEREQFWKHESDGHRESVSEGSSTPVNRWVIICNGNYHEEESPISPTPPVFHPTHLEGHNSLKEEESQTPIPTIDKSHQSDPTTALETRGDRQAQAEDVGWSGTQARSCLSVDSDSNGSSEPFLRQSRRKCFVKIKSRSERSRRSTSISMAGD